MSDLLRFRSLTVRERAIVCIGVLLDGHDAVDSLASDRERAPALSRAARDLALIPHEIRMPLLGTLLREAIAQIRVDED